MAQALIKYETIDEQQIKQIMQGKQPSAPEGWDEDSTNKDDQNKQHVSEDNTKANDSTTQESEQGTI